MTYSGAFHQCWNKHFSAVPRPGKSEAAAQHYELRFLEHSMILHLRIYLGSLCALLCLISGCSCTPEAYQQSASAVPKENGPPAPSATPAASARPKASPKSPPPASSSSAQPSSAPAPLPPSQQPSPSSAGANSSSVQGENSNSGLTGAIADFFGGSRNSKGGAAGRQTPSGASRTPQEAASDAQKLIDEAKERFAADDPSAALGAGIAAYDLLSPHQGDAACQGLLKSLEADLRRYSEAVDSLPISTAKPSRIR